MKSLHSFFYCELPSNNFILDISFYFQVVEFKWQVLSLNWVGTNWPLLFSSLKLIPSKSPSISPVSAYLILLATTTRKNKGMEGFSRGAQSFELTPTKKSNSQRIRIQIYAIVLWIVNSNLEITGLATLLEGVNNNKFSKF